MLSYSPSTGGFYDSEIHEMIPPDAQPISGQLHRDLLDAQSRGQMIVADGGGAPIAIDRPPLTMEQAMSALRIERDQRLAASDWTQMPDAPLGDAARAAWRGYRQALRDLPETVTDPAAIAWPVAPA